MADEPSNRWKRRQPCITAQASKQWGNVTTAQLADCGVSGAVISRWVAEGRLDRVLRGVYAVGHRSPAPEAFWAAVLLGYGEASVLTRRTSLALHGLGQPPHTITVAVPKQARRRRRVEPPFLDALRTRRSGDPTRAAHHQHRADPAGPRGHRRARRAARGGGDRQAADQRREAANLRGAPLRRPRGRPPSQLHRGKADPEQGGGGVRALARSAGAAEAGSTCRSARTPSMSSGAKRGSSSRSTPTRPTEPGIRSRPTASATGLCSARDCGRGA